ncbi:MAG: PAS domain-containing protein [Acidobacteriota bacterium]
MSDVLLRDPSIPQYEGVVTLGAPRDPDFAAFLRWWEDATRTRPLPSRADFDPTQHKRLLPHIFIMEAVPAPDYYVQRLVGSTVEAFYGTRLGGQALRQSFGGDGADRLTRLYDAIRASRKPCFRTGYTYWWARKSYRRFESCFFPLSPDGLNVNMIIGGIKFFTAEVLDYPGPRARLGHGPETMAPGRGDIRPGAGLAPARGDCADAARNSRCAAISRPPGPPRRARPRRPAA